MLPSSSITPSCPASRTASLGSREYKLTQVQSDSPGIFQVLSDQISGLSIASWHAHSVTQLDHSQAHLSWFLVIPRLTMASLAHVPGVANQIISTSVASWYAHNDASTAIWSFSNLLQ